MANWRTRTGSALLFLLACWTPALPQTPAKPKLTIEQLIDIKHPSNPVWSPDGKRVLFSWDRAGVANLYVASLDGHGQPAALTSFADGQVDQAFWSKDSQTVYFPHAGDLWQVPANGGSPKPVWTTAARESGIVPSPDGAW